MPISLIVKSKYKGNVRDYMTLNQFATYISTGQVPPQTWKQVKEKRLAIKNKKNIK
jgi:hypothetical protein